jgi:hypothetical protein
MFAMRMLASSNGGSPPHDYRIFINAILFVCWCLGVLIVASKVKNTSTALLIQMSLVLGLLVVGLILWLAIPPILPW